jgi:hypothetical protein
MLLPLLRARAAVAVRCYLPQRVSAEGERWICVFFASPAFVMLGGCCWQHRKVFEKHLGLIQSKFELAIR